MANKLRALAQTRLIIRAKANIIIDFYPLTEVNGNEK
jgi:hypothetical protein